MFLFSLWLKYITSTREAPSGHSPLPHLVLFLAEYISFPKIRVFLCLFHEGREILVIVNAVLPGLGWLIAALNKYVLNLLNEFGSMNEFR